MRYFYSLILLFFLSIDVLWATATSPPKPAYGEDGRPMVLIQSNTFTMGSGEREETPFFSFGSKVSDEAPAHPVLLSAFYIDQFEVSVYDYQQYIAQTNKAIPKHGAGIIPLLNKVPLFYKEQGLFQVQIEGRLMTTGEFRQLAESLNFTPYNWTSGNADEEPAYLSGRDVEFVLTIHPDYQVENADDVWVFNVNPDYPVVSVTWLQAFEYCRYYGKRLPSEAEWEYAARGGMTSELYPWGDEPPAGKAVFRTAEALRSRPEAIGSFSPNGYGLYDMSGNVWEWVADWYSAEYYQVSFQEGKKVFNPYNNNVSSEKVIRGGGWTSLAEDLRVTNRNRQAPNKAKLNIGFRCAVSAN